jgi:hypothetical protein
MLSPTMIATVMFWPASLLDLVGEELSVLLIPFAAQ